MFHVIKHACLAVGDLFFTPLRMNDKLLLFWKFHQYLHNKHYMAAWGYEFYLLVLIVSLTRSLHSLVRDAALEDKIRIPKRQCKIISL